MMPNKEVKCPYTGFSKTCFDGVTKHQCPKWIQILGAHPQTGEQLNKWGCTDTIIPFLLLENSKLQRETGAAVESFRNEMVRMNQPYLEAPNPPRTIDVADHHRP